MTEPSECPWTTGAHGRRLYRDARGNYYEGIGRAGRKPVPTIVEDLVKRAFFVTLALILFLTAGLSTADGSSRWTRSVSRFECGSRLVAVGDSRFEVLRKCGEPSWRDAWQEERLERVGGVPYFDGSPFYASRDPILVNVHVLIEEWVYNRGPSRFMRILRFENNRLIDIQVGDYGY